MYIHRHEYIHLHIYIHMNIRYIHTHTHTHTHTKHTHTHTHKHQRDLRNKPRSLKPRTLKGQCLYNTKSQYIRVLLRMLIRVVDKSRRCRCLKVSAAKSAHTTPMTIDDVKTKTNCTCVSKGRNVSKVSKVSKVSQVSKVSKVSQVSKVSTVNVITESSTYKGWVHDRVHKYVCIS